MSGAQSSLLSFPGPGARGSRLVALWVTEMESCQGYHGGTLRYGWLAASCLDNAAEQRMPVDVVPVEPFPDRVSVVSRRASMKRRACCSGLCGGLCWSLGSPVGSTDRTSSARAGRGRTRESWSVDGARYKCREVGGRKSKWAMEGCWTHTADRGLDHAQSAGSWGARIPCRPFATKMRVQGGVVAPCFAQLRVCLSGRCVAWCGVN